MRLAATAAAALLALASCREASPARAPDGARPVLHLLPPLPLLWSESFGLEQPGSAAIKRLEAGWRVVPVDLPRQAAAGGLLLAAQPRALPAEELVALDRWVRRGGRLLLLADPALEWPSERPLGDPRRPPVMFPDTGLLRHWGLQLEAPDKRGPTQAMLAGKALLVASPGQLRATGGRCAVDAGGLAARCAIGRGKVVVIADADFLNVDAAAGLDGPTGDNLAALESELRSLSR